MEALPKTGFIATIEVNQYEADFFMSRIKSNIEICETVGMSLPVGSVKEILLHAQRLFRKDQEEESC